MRFAGRIAVGAPFPINLLTRPIAIGKISLRTFRQTVHEEKLIAMSANASDLNKGNATTPPVAAPGPDTSADKSAAVPKKITNAQTVCNEKNEKGKLCNGHLKQLRT